MNSLIEIPVGTANAKPAIVGRSLVKEYGAHRAVDGVDFALPVGGTLALIGHNGAGKTTLMKLILGLVRPSSGELEVLGRQPASAGLDYRRQIGFLPENVAFHDELSGIQTLQFYARLKSVAPSECGLLLERVGLAFAADRRVKTYSKGMRQRLGLAQALLGLPRLLLLDEPTTGLDPNSRIEFFRIVKELSERGATVIISSHILTELEAKTDLVAIMNAGKLAAFGPLDELRRQASLPVRFLIASPKGVAAAVGRLQGFRVTTRLAEDGQTAEIWCRVEDKMQTLAALTQVGSAISDIDIRHPGLDEIYRHFSPQAEGGEA